MSSYLVSTDHILTLANFLGEDRDYSCDGKEITDTLYSQNLHALRCRYGEKDHRDVPQTLTYKNHDISHISPLTIAKLCEEYDYQASDDPEYQSRKAHRFITAIRRKALRRIHGYEGAPHHAKLGGKITKISEMGDRKPEPGELISLFS